MATINGEVAGGQGISLAQAAALIPPARAGRPVSPSCVFRWIRDGVKTPSGERVHLEAARLGGRLITSRAALERFMDAQSPGARHRTVRTPSRRRRESAHAGVALAEKYGI
jgi:hypothetical protein